MNPKKLAALITISGRHYEMISGSAAWPPLMVSGQLVVSCAQAVPLGGGVPEIATVDVDVAVEAGVAAGRGVSHGPGAALCAVEPEAGSDTVEGRLWQRGTGSESAALTSAHCATASDHSAAPAAVATAVVVARLRGVAAAVGCVGLDVGG